MGNAGVLSSARPARPTIVPTVHGTENEATPPSTYPGTAAATSAENPCIKQNTLTAFFAGTLIWRFSAYFLPEPGVHNYRAEIRSATILAVSSRNNVVSAY